MFEQPLSMSDASTVSGNHETSTEELVTKIPASPSASPRSSLTRQRPPLLPHAFSADHAFQPVLLDMTSKPTILALRAHGQTMQLVFIVHQRLACDALQRDHSMLLDTAQDKARGHVLSGYTAGHQVCVVVRSGRPSQPTAHVCICLLAGAHSETL